MPSLLILLAPVQSLDSRTYHRTVSQIWVNDSAITNAATVPSPSSQILEYQNPLSPGLGTEAMLQVYIYVLFYISASIILILLMTPDAIHYES